MDKTQINFRRNLLVMILPVIIPAIPIMLGLGESVLLFAVPLVIGLILSISLAKRLSIKDAIAYPFVQYAFFFMLFYLFWAYPNVGLGMILVIPMIYIINTAVGYTYFRFVKNKATWGKMLVLIATLLITSLLYSEHYGPNRSTPVLFRMAGGDFGDVNLVREHVRTDTLQITDNGLFEYRLEQVHRSTPFWSTTELRLFVRNTNTGAEYHIRLDDVMNEARLPRPGSSSAPAHWITMQATDETQQLYKLTTTSAYAPVRRWVFELNMEAQTVSLLEQIHVSMLGRTEDDQFIADLYMVNFFDDPNRSIRLVMRDTETREMIHIPIEIDVAEVLVRNFDWGWDLLEEVDAIGPTNRVVWVMPTDVPKVYTVVLREGFLVRERRFELDMNAKVMTELD
ncbi:MAG: hypothetical protein FWD03_01115 [Defluviitaleaceae bacterium]|nr:hypothetical protein [Defluviitaleaceae bacterium]